jgi:ferredoxin
VQRSSWAHATDDDETARDEVLGIAMSRINRGVDREGVPALLARNIEHPLWSEIAERCLGCANCTMACPTCFCSDVRDVTDLAGDSERRRTWSSCFDVDHSFLHGGPVRSSPSSRYRQWMTHKFSTWWDQFDSSGCVGCGRCVTWCPVGIDVTAELAILRDSEQSTGDVAKASAP